MTALQCCPLLVNSIQLSVQQSPCATYFVLSIATPVGGTLIGLDPGHTYSHMEGAIPVAGVSTFMKGVLL